MLEKIDHARGRGFNAGTPYHFSMPNSSLAPSRYQDEDDTGRVPAHKHEPSRHGLAVVPSGPQARQTELSPILLERLVHPSVDMILRSLQERRPESSIDNDLVLLQFSHTLHLIQGKMSLQKDPYIREFGVGQIVENLDEKEGRQHRWDILCVLDAANNLKVSYFLRDNLGEIKSDNPFFEVMLKVDDPYAGNQLIYKPKNGNGVTTVLSGSEMREPQRRLHIAPSSSAKSHPFHAVRAALVKLIKAFDGPEEARPDRSGDIRDMPGARVSS